MTTFTAFTTLDCAAKGAALGEALEALEPTPMGVGVFEIEDGSGMFEVGGYFTEPPDIAGLALLSAVHGAQDFVVSKLDDRDWVAQVRRELTPVEAGRFVVYGAHDANKISLNQIGLRIEAAMAFGTGHHGTTLGCLLSLGRLIKLGMQPDRIADIGTGTGVLAMAAAKTWPATIVASDIDQIAVDTTKANCAANALTSKIRCLKAIGFRHPALRSVGPYDLILANILANPLKAMAPDMASNTRSGSRIILSGILNRQANSVVAVYASHGFVLDHRRQIGEWTTLTLVRNARLPQKETA